MTIGVLDSWQQRRMKGRLRAEARHLIREVAKRLPEGREQMLEGERGQLDLPRRSRDPGLPSQTEFLLEGPRQ